MRLAGNTGAYRLDAREETNKMNEQDTSRRQSEADLVAVNVN